MKYKIGDTITTTNLTLTNPIRITRTCTTYTAYRNKPNTKLIENTSTTYIVKDGRGHYYNIDESQIISQEKKEDKTLSNLSSGATKQGGINSQDDRNLQLERSASLPVDNHPSDNQLKEIKEQIERNNKEIQSTNKLIDKLVKETQTTLKDFKGSDPLNMWGGTEESWKENHPSKETQTKITDFKERNNFVEELIKNLEKVGITEKPNYKELTLSDTIINASDPNPTAEVLFVDDVRYTFQRLRSDFGNSPLNEDPKKNWETFNKIIDNLIGDKLI